MREDDIKKSFDNVKPDDIATQRMLNNVLNHSDNKREVSLIKSLNLRKAIPIFAAVFVIVGGLIAFSLGSNNGRDKILEGKRANGTDVISREDGEMAAVGDMAAPVTNQFQIDNKHYIILSDEQKAEFKLPGTISKSDIGDKLTTIVSSVDESLKGLEVYKYLPAGGEAVVAVKKDNEYTLFKFFTFESYNNNQDEDVSAYLKLYGINSGADIEKIQFVGYSEQAKIANRLDIISEITDSGKINEFYDYYSIIKNSSDKYFQKLYNYKSSNSGGQSTGSGQTEVPPDYVKGAAIDLPEKEPNADKINYAEDSIINRDAKASDTPVKSGDTPAADTKPSVSTDTGKAGSTSGSAGSSGDALFNSVTIRIYNQSGLYFDTVYYPNIGFISRHEVKDDFAGFLKDYLGN